MTNYFSYQPTLHWRGSLARAGRCSHHTRDGCDEAPVISFQDEYLRWQSGCFRALTELAALEPEPRGGTIIGARLARSAATGAAPSARTT